MLRQRNKCCDIMETRRQNYVVIMNFYVATLVEKFLKKYVATFLVMSLHCSKHMAVEIFRDILQLCRGIES